MVERTLRIINPLGLHARAAAQVVRLAGRFVCLITLSRSDTGVSANAKSILSVLHLAAGAGVELVITTSGPDENEAMAELEMLFRVGFGEI